MVRLLLKNRIRRRCQSLTLILSSMRVVIQFVTEVQYVEVLTVLETELTAFMQESTTQAKYLLLQHQIMLAKIFGQFNLK